MTLADDPMQSLSDARRVIAEGRAAGVGSLRAQSGRVPETGSALDIIRRGAREAAPPPTFADLGYRHLSVEEQHAANRRSLNGPGFWASFGGTLTSAESLPFVGGGFTAGKLGRFIYLDNKLRARGLDADEEREHVGMWADLVRDPGVREMAGDILGAIPGFAFEIGTGAGITSAAARTAARRILRDRAASAATKALAKRLARSSVLGAATQVAGLTAASEAVPEMFGMGGGKWTAYALQRALPELRNMDAEDWETLEGLANGAVVDMLQAKVPLWQGALDQAIEVGSEMAGAPLGKAIARTAAGARVLALQSKVLNRIAGAVGHEGAEFLDDLATRVRYDGPILEFLEERLGDVARVGTGLEDLDSLVPDLDELAAEAFALSMPALGGAALRRSINVHQGTLASDAALRPQPKLDEVEPLSAEDSDYVLQRLARVGVKGARIVAPETDLEREAAAYAASSGRKLALVEADDMAGVGGVSLRPDLIVVSRAEAAPDMLAAHELTETVGLVSSTEERARQAEALEAVRPGILDAAFAEWQARVAAGGKATKGDPAKLRVDEGAATVSEWVAPVMLYAARSDAARDAVARVAAQDGTGFWRRLWHEVRAFLGLASAKERAAYVAELGAREAARETGAPLTEREAAQVAQDLAGYVSESADRARAAGPAQVQQEREEAESARAAAAEAARQEREAAIPTREQRSTARVERQVAAQARKHPKPGDIVRVTSRGNQGLADVLALTNEGTPQERLRVRLRADVRGEPGGRAQVGNRSNRTIEVPRSEVRLHELRAPDAVSDLGGRQRQERERAEKEILDAAARKLTTADPVKEWNRKVSGGRPAKPWSKVKGKGAQKKAVAPKKQVGVRAVKPPKAPKEPKDLERLPPTPLPVVGPAAEAEEGDPIPFDEEEPEIPGVGHQTELPNITVAEERLARTLAQRITAMAPFQSAYQGNKREFMENEALNLARLLVTAQDSEELYDWYAGGGTYGLSLAVAKALPKLKRVTVNEADPIKNWRLRLSMEEGAAFLDIWRTSKFLGKVYAAIAPLRAGTDSTSSMKSALKHMRGDVEKADSVYARFRAMRGEYESASDREKAAIVAVLEMASSKMKAQSLDEVIQFAREDAEKLKHLTAAAFAQGLEVRVSQLNSFGDEALEVVKSGRPATLLLDPPYHKSDAGTYVDPSGMKLDMASDQALALYTHGASRMARLGHVAVYHNKATPEARDMLYRALGGDTHIRTWARQKRGDRKQGLEVVGYVYGRDLARGVRDGGGGDAGGAVAGATDGGGVGAVLEGAGVGEPGVAGSVAAGARQPGARQNSRGRLAARFDVVGAADFLYDALNGLSGERRSRGVSLLAEQSVAEEQTRGWDPFDGYGLPVRSGAPVIEQSLVERLALRPASQRRERPLTLVDHILSMGGIDLRGMQLTNEAGDIVERILAGRGANASGIPAGLIYLPDSKAKSGGMRPDNILEGLASAGFRGEDPDGRMSFDDLIDGIEAELNGDWPRVPQGEEALLAAEGDRLEVLRETEQLMSATVEDVADAPRAPGDLPPVPGLFDFDDTAAPFAPAGMRPWSWKFAPAAALPDKVTVDGVERHTRNSEGLPIADTWAKIVAFWRWFGNSDATDSDGRPAVMYHAGTFDEIGDGVVMDLGEGFHLGSFRAATERAVEKAVSMQVDSGTVFHAGPGFAWRSADGKVSSADFEGYYPSAMAARTAMRTWFEIEYGFESDSHEKLWERGFRVFAGYVRSGKTFVSSDIGMGWEAVIGAAKRNGIGSIAYRNQYEDRGSTAWLVWDPTAVKSVENAGTFAADDPRVRYAPGWHGGPRKFDRFSTKYVNSGEGAQAYGWGLYFASLRKIAEWYRDRLRSSEPRAVMIDGRPIYSIANELLDPEHELGFLVFNAMSTFYRADDAVRARREMAEMRLANPEVTGRDRQEAEAELAFIQFYGDRLSVREEDRGALYRVELAPSEDEYLLWDQPFDLQSKKVQDGLLRALGMDVVSRAVGNAGYTGAWLYGRAVAAAEKAHAVAVRNAAGGAPQVASENLYLAGIRGVKYLDATSRGTSEESYNYVIFDDSDVEIVERFAPAFIEVDGVQRPTRNSEGRLIAGTEEALRSFWRWFAGSAVVDDDGRPIVFYHGTSQDFSIFDRTASTTVFRHPVSMDHVGSWFSSSPDAAANYAMNPAVMPVYLRLRRPAHLTFDQFLEDGQQFDFDWDESKAAGGFDGGAVREFYSGEGYDGIAFLDAEIDGMEQRVYVAFDPAQIKSATGNAGTFDPSNPDVRFAPAGARARASAQRKAKLRARGAARAAAERRSRSTMDVLAEMLSTDVHEVGRVQDEVWARTGKADESTDFVGQIDLARSKAPAEIEDLMQRLIERVSRFKGKGALEDLQRLVYVKTAPDRNAWLRVRQADEYLRGRLEAIGKVLAQFGSKMDPGRLGKFRGEVNAIERVLQAEPDARVTYALRRGVKINETPAGIDNLEAARELERLTAKLGRAEATAFLEWIRAENRASLDLEVASGLLSAETANQWHEREPYYVSLRDVDPEMDSAAGYRSGRSMSVGKPYSKALGRESETEGALQAWLEDKIRRRELAARNEALNTGARLARSSGADSGLEVLDRRPREDQTPFAVAFYENGQKRWLLFPTVGAADALKGLHGKQVGELLGLIGHGTRFFSRMVTSRNPGFWLPNFLRDTTHALWTLTAERGFKEGAKVWARAWALLPSVLRSEFKRDGKHFDAIREAKLAGVKTTWIGPRDAKELLQQMMDALADQRGPKHFVRSALRAFDAISDGFEAATRVAAYQVLRESGLSARDAALAAKNLTVNFDRKGTLTPALSALYSFFNPGVQGSLRLIKAATGSKRGMQVTAATVTIGVVWEMLCYALSDDDEQTGLPVYGLLSQWSKERMLHLPFAVNGAYLTYPLPYGIASIFGAGRRAAHLIAPDMDPVTTAPQMLWGAVVQGLNEFQPMGNVTDPVSSLAPTLIRPVVEVELNRKFTGAPIMRDKTSFGEELPDSARAFTTIGDRASGWLGQIIADVLNAGGPDDVETGIDVSPETMQHYIEWLTSGYGLRELDRVSQFFMSSREVPALPNTPFLRNFTNQVASQAISEDYYQLRDRAESIWKRAKDARGERRTALLKEDPELYGMAARFRGVDRQLRGLQRRMDGASREERIALQRQRVALQGEMVRAYYGSRE